MNDFLVNGLVVVAGVLLVMAATCGVAFVFFRWGWEKGRDERQTERRHGEGDLSSLRRAVGESSGRHHFVPPSDDRTDTFAPVVRPGDMLADDDSIPGKRLREFYRQSRLRWPDDMELAEQRSIVEDQWHKHNDEARSWDERDAADRGGHQ